MSKPRDKKIEMHQHVDEHGVVCGKLHPIDGRHFKLSTRIRHNNTVGVDSKYYQRIYYCQDARNDKLPRK